MCKAASDSLKSGSTSIGNHDKSKHDDVHKTSEKAPEAEKPEGLRLDTDNDQSAHDLEASGASSYGQFLATGRISDLEEAIQYFTRALTLTAAGHTDSDKSRRHANLGVSYGNRYRRLNDLADLEKSIECFTHSLESAPEGSNKSGQHASLGVPYTDRYQRLGNLADLEKAIECFTRALDSTPDDHPNKSYRHASLGVSYTDRYRCLRELADLDKAIECFTRALGSAPEGFDKSRQHANLGVCYTDRYRRLSNFADLDEAVICHTRALEATPNGHADMPHRHASLGLSYTDRYQSQGDLADLEKAIECHTRALELTPDGHPNKSGRHANLGASYTDRYRRLDELEDLKKAIECFTRALESAPEDSDKSRQHANLGVCHTDQYRHLGELADLERAIECYTNALKLTVDDHPDKPDRHANLGVAYSDRYQRLGNIADLEQAIECHTCALSLTPEGPDKSDRLANLGVCYTDRYRRLGELADLEKAIECDTSALASTLNGHPHMSHRHHSLGVSYTDRYQRLGDVEDLEKAIEYHIQALALTPEGHVDKSGRHANLGMCYTDRFRRLGKLADLEEAVKCHTRALELTPDGHLNKSGQHASLGVSYDNRYERLGDPADLEKAIECHTRALELTPDDHPQFPTRHLRHAVSLLHQYKRTGHLACSANSLHSFRIASNHFTGAPRDRFQHALQWAKFATTQSLLNPIEAYQTAINLLPQFIWLGATTNQRYQDLTLTDNLAVNACFVAIQSSNYSLALEWLEHARCVVWNQSLMLRSPLDQLHTSYPDLATRLQSISGQLHTSSFDSQPIQSTVSGSMTPEKVGQERRRLATEYHNLLAQTRQLHGFESFMQPLKANRLISGVRNGPVVVLNCHADRCDALVIMPGHDRVTHLPLPSFTQQKARQARLELYLSLGKKGIRRRGIKVKNEMSHTACFETVLGTLWNTIVQPVLKHLGYLNDTPREHLPHITWCPTGLISFLPLHAAGDYSQSQSRIYNYAISSYIPALSALLASTPSQLNGSCRVLAISQASTPGQNALPGTTEELTLVEAHMHNTAEYSQLVDSQATITAVLDAMEKHDWVHLACHASQNVKDPIKSGFHLHDGTLNLSAISQRSFKNKGLAFLSACQTATGDENLPDEAVHLASGMLMAGYSSVIATMWSVNDNDAPSVADKVYAQLMKDGKLGNGEAGRALHYAVVGLREKIGEKEFGRWVPYIHIGS
ncbi:unnamed protein product [Rhizoctonia solani]|uniref:CHAT domain-containing protein n=1 Tax=Rhizoctonia solani TaxID=456999 RepID=A0A8H3BMT9_9AGAM|nr:unnamed protein product [Rhizoctonia solani]